MRRKFRHRVWMVVDPQVVVAPRARGRRRGEQPIASPLVAARRLASLQRQQEPLDSSRFLGAALPVRLHHGLDDPRARSACARHLETGLLVMSRTTERSSSLW